jgi:hypothetical protein
MGLFDFLKRKKKTGEAAPEADALLDLNDVDPAMIDPPETRYTQEYQDFLAQQEAAGHGGDPGAE